MKILYAAGSRTGAYHQMRRLLPAITPKHEVRVASYLCSLRELPADYCLDALGNFLSKREIGPYGPNYKYYASQVRKWRPDLVISDMDRVTSMMALEAGLPLWQVSSALLFYGLTTEWKRRLKIRDFTRLDIEYSAWQADLDIILLQSQRRMVLSHLGDLSEPPELSNSYEWLRPEFMLQEHSETDGSPHELADNFYSQKFSIINYNHADLDISPHVAATTYYRLGQFSTHPFRPERIEIVLNPQIQFISELLQ